MTKELRALLQNLDSKKTEVRTMIAKEQTADAKEMMAEVRDLQSQVDMQKELEQDEQRDMGGTPHKTPAGEEREKDMTQLEQEYTGIVLNAVRRRNITQEQRSIITEYEKRAVMHTGSVTGQDGGDSSLVIPQDIQTRINELMRAWGDLSQYVNMQNVNAPSGTRVLEKDEDMTPFADVDEYGEIQQQDNPTFTPISYALKKRAGYLPLTNELIADNDAGLVAYIQNWIAKKATYTRNTHIVSLLKTLPKKTVGDFKELNTVINVDLDPAVSATAILLTNQDGFNWMDNQYDANGRPYLQEDITQPGRKMYKGRPVVVVPNKVFATRVDAGDSFAPIVVGNLKQFMVLWNKKFFELTSTKEGGDAWRRDTTEMRTIIRDDYTKWDDKSAVFTEVDVTPAV